MTHHSPSARPEVSPRVDDDEVLELSRRKFMAGATIALGGMITLGLSIPLVGAVVPSTRAGRANWTPLDEAGWKELLEASDTPVQISITLKAKDAYLPEQDLPQDVWGIKIKNEKAFKAERPDLFADGKDILPYRVVTLGFAMFSPICPHLGCRYQWNRPAAPGKFWCPCHGSTYTRDGAHVAGPAARGLDPLPLRERSGHAEIEWTRFAPTIPNRLILSYTD